nr:hypothetical protein [Tanacetum cinerariifolium]
MKAGGKDCPLMLAPGNYVQWKSRIKRYIDTKPNNELIHYYLQNPPYKFKWAERIIPVAEDVEAKVVQIILTRIDNDIYSTVDACPNACEMWKAIERDGETPESYYSRFYKMMNELVRNQCDVTNHQVNVQFLLQLQPEWQRFVTLVKQSQELKTVSYHKLYDILKQHQNKVNEIRAERLARTANPLTLEKEAHYLYIAQIQEVTLDAADNSEPIFDDEPLQKVQNDDDNYYVFANDREHSEQPKSVNDTYLDEQGDINITTGSLDMSNNRGDADQDDDDDLAREHDLLASLIEKLKREINESKYRVISTTGVSRPQLKSNRLKDRVIHNNSQGKKQQVEDHCRNFKFSNNKMPVTTCNDSLNVNSKTKPPIVVPISTQEPKRNVNQSVAIPLKKIVATESPNQKPKSTTRKQYDHVSKTCRWWYSKITPPGYKWKPKTSIMNVKPNVSMPLGTKSKTTNILDSITLKGSNLSNTPLSSNYFVARKDNPVHRRLWVLKGNDLLIGSRGTNLYSITLQEPNPICLMAKALSS